jgi:uncharacterized protein (TIGR02246 family)
MVRRGMKEFAMVTTPTVQALLEQWIDAFNRHDLDAHMALYAEDAMLIGSTDVLQIGRDAIRAYFGARGPHVRVAHYHPPHVTQVMPDVALTAAHVDFADGATAMPYRVTWALVKRDGNWLIAQHHGSPRRDPVS